VSWRRRDEARILKGDELIYMASIGDHLFQVMCDKHGDVTDDVEDVQDGPERYTVCFQCWRDSPDIALPEFMEVEFVKDTQGDGA
jgi:hypothetical protein